MARTGGRGGLAAGDSQAARPSTSTGRRDLKALFVSAEVSGGWRRWTAPSMPGSRSSTVCIIKSVVAERVRF
ncbi:unnamed protein product [Urochloa humidicola]